MGWAGCMWVKPGMRLSACCSARVTRASCRVLDLELHVVEGVADPELEVGGHLVIARAGRVQAARGRTDQLAKPCFDIEVDVLELPAEGEGPGLDLPDDRLQAALDLRPSSAVMIFCLTSMEAWAWEAVMS